VLLALLGVGLATTSALWLPFIVGRLVIGALWAARRRFGTEGDRSAVAP
jgi:hypothetical protein